MIKNRIPTDRQHIAPSKAWERGISNERMKPFERIQLVKVQSGYPPLTLDDIRAAISYAANLTREEEILPFR
jgi:hypothetical protein